MSVLENDEEDQMDDHFVVEPESDFIDEDGSSSVIVEQESSSAMLFIPSERPSN